MLAGGRSRRFGSDKLIAQVDGIPLLHLALRAAAAAVDEVVIVAPSTGLKPKLPADLERPMTVARDELAHPGPLAGLLTGARSARGIRLLVVGADMPDLRPAVLRRLLAWTVGVGSCLVASAERQVLPLGLDRSMTVATAERLLGGGERSLRALVTSLVLEEITEAEWRTLDPDGATLRDVDRPEDLGPLS